MVGMLAQDLLGGLETLFVLLGFVILYDMAEQRLLLRRQRLCHGGICRPGGLKSHLEERK